jgi:hypothetical protein
VLCSVSSGSRTLKLTVPVDALVGCHLGGSSITQDYIRPECAVMQEHQEPVEIHATRRKKICLPEFSVKTAEYAVGPRNPLFRNDEVKLSGDLWEMVDDICLPCAVPRVIGSIGEGCCVGRVGAVISSCKLEGLIGAADC